MKNYPMVKLGDICDILNGFAFKSENYVKSGLRIIRISNVQKGYLEDKDPKFYPIDSIKSFDDFILKSDDILMSLTGNVGRVAVIKDSFLPAVLNQRVACLRPNNNVLNSKYLFQILNSDFFEKNCIDNAKGIAQKNMSTEWLKLYRIPLPNLQIQYEISTNIGKITEIIEKRKEQLSKLDELAKSRFIEMFGDVESNPNNLEISTLGRECLIVSGATPPTGKPEYWNGDIKWITPAEIGESEYIISNTIRHITQKGKDIAHLELMPKGTILLSSRAPIGKLAITNVEMTCNQGFKNLIPKSRLTSIFLYYYLKGIIPQIQSMGRGATFKEISKPIVSSIKILVPHKREQVIFGSFIQRLDKSKFRMKKCLKMMSFIRHL